LSLIYDGKPPGHCTLTITPLTDGTVMKAIQLSEKEITYTLRSLRRHEKALLEEEGEEMGDTLTDLLMIQSLIEKLSAAKQDH
jgi:hypothetical protein